MAHVSNKRTPLKHPLMATDNQHIPSGYKPSPLGIIPEDWEVKTLGECTNLLTNGFVGVATPHYTEDPDGITYIQGFNVIEGGFNLTGIKKVTRAFHKKNSKSSLREGDLLTIQTGDIGLTTIVTKELEGSNCHALIISRFKEMILPQFMLYYYNSSIGRNRFRVIETGTTMKHINTGDLVKFSIPVPPLPEQQRIVSLLSLWDTAIAKQTALIEQLTLRKRGLMQQLLTGKKRLKGFEGYAFHRLGNYISECNRRNNGCKRVLSVTNTRGFILQEEQFDKIVASNDTSNYKVVRRGEFAYNPSRVNVGSLAMLNEYDEGILSPMYIVFKANENIDKSYLLQSLQSWWFRGHIPAYTQGSVRDSLSFDGLCSMKFYIPTLQEQKAISAILEQADKEIEIQKQKLAAMQEQKKGLMQVLLTGKKRIK